MRRSRRVKEAVSSSFNEIGLGAAMLRPEREDFYAVQLRARHRRRSIETCAIPQKRQHADRFAQVPSAARSLDKEAHQRFLLV
jgi:hypothetical protein